VDGENAPPKPSRQPGHENLPSTTAAPASVQTYIVAQNPEVLMQLLRENERRGVNPSVYTTPANAFNTLAVDFDSEDTVSPLTLPEEVASPPVQVGRAVCSSHAVRRLHVFCPFFLFYEFCF